MILPDRTAAGPYRVIDPAELSVPDVLSRARRARLRRDATIEYSAAAHPDLPGSHLFWGPYFELDAGVYLLKFRGSIEGELIVEWAHRGGRERLRRDKLVSFDSLISLVAVKSVTDLEVRGLKSKDLRSFVLEGIDIYQAYAAT